MLVQVVSYNKRSVEPIMAEQFQLLGIVIPSQSFFWALHVENVKNYFIWERKIAYIGHFY